MRGGWQLLLCEMWRWDDSFRSPARTLDHGRDRGGCGVVGAKGTRVGKNLHAAASACFNSTWQGKEMVGRALVLVRRPRRGRSGVSGEVCGAWQEEGWGSGRCQTHRRGGLSVNQGISGVRGVHGPLW
jgi:hypothetical protein